MEAELVSVNQSTERWSEYLLDDGSLLRLKPVVTEVWRFLNAYDNDGNPIYMAKSNNILSVQAPDELRRPQ